jgi:hypothetical protein
MICIFPGMSAEFSEPNVESESLEYVATRHGNIVGFCGCFVVCLLHDHTRE